MEEDVEGSEAAAVDLRSVPLRIGAAGVSGGPFYF